MGANTKLKEFEFLLLVYPYDRLSDIPFYDSLQLQKSQEEESCQAISLSVVD